MLLRIVAVISGVVVCQAVFSLLAVATMQFWPEYASHAHHYLDHKLFTFTAIMACLNLLFWVLGCIGAGWATARITTDSKALWALAGLMLSYAVYVHVLSRWSEFPWWYNLTIVFSVIPATSLGAFFTRKPEGGPLRRCSLVGC